jgi:hypothetical protein
LSDTLRVLLFGVLVKRFDIVPLRIDQECSVTVRMIDPAA